MYVFSVLTSCVAFLTTLVLARRVVGGQLRQTTLTTAGVWALLMSVVWSTAWLLEFVLATLSDGAADLLWYSAAIIGLCPPIAVLGAKRPGVRVWNVFILLPLAAVFGWAALADGPAAIRDGGFQIEMPVTIGFFIVSVMGIGNYIGTRWTFPALGYCFACWTILTRATLIGEREYFPNLQMFGFWLMIGCLLAVCRFSRVSPIKDKGFDRVWLEFRDWFGIVWSKRIQERVNDTASKEDWCARLEHHGFEWSPDATEEQRAETNERIDHTLRWLLRRFVNDEWIDERL